MVPTAALPLVFAVPAKNLVVGQGRIEPPESDGNLVRRARQGDRWAEEALYHRHVRSVTRAVLRLLAHGAEAEDAVQDAFIVALRDLDKLRDPDAFGSWLLTIAVRQVHRRFRKRRILRALGLDGGDGEAALAEQVDPGAGPEVAAALSQVDRILARVPSMSRIAWVLRRVEGHELRDVAACCGCSLATVKRHVARVEAALAAHVTFSTPGGGDDE
jgi:RNA polymerase sigma-70 factor (ECF subfamily)